MLSVNRFECKSNKNKFIKKEETEELLCILRLKTPRSKINLIENILKIQNQLF